MENIRKIFPDLADFVVPYEYEPGKSKETMKQLTENHYIIVASGENLFYIVHETRHPGYFLNVEQEWMHVLP